MQDCGANVECLSE
ncbi:rCG50357 [Rattus norvegicus]|uniref:RCG50357 n=1 Tax=Rattus norvegicus TaxID=10116 RepID=A6JZJ9_RAT|nr:rCG50357 [Rattus norvegicus]